LLIDPTDENIDPEEHLDFLNYEIFDKDYGSIGVKNNSRYGRETINVIGLDNRYNTMRRREHLEDMRTVFGVLLLARDQEEPVIVQAMLSQIRLMVSAKGKLAAVARAYARKEQIDVNFGIPIPTGWECA